MSKNKFAKLSSNFTGDVSKIDSNVMSAICKDPWLITPEALDVILMIANRSYNNPEAVSLKTGEPLPGNEMVTVRGDTAIIDIKGPIFRYANLFTQISGATSIEALAKEFNAALEDGNVKRIILDVDSPGGQVIGVPELAAIIKAADKEVIAYISGQGTSAAYWLASAANKLYVNDTAIVGSIGVAMNIKEGAGKGVIEIISSQSPNKNISPETDAGKAHLQSVVD